MSAPIIEKPLTVTAINVVYELATKEPMYQVNFGMFIDTTPELERHLTMVGGGVPFPGKKVAVNWLVINIKTNGQVPYKVGSKWKLTVNETGQVNMVEM